MRKDIGGNKQCKHQNKQNKLKWKMKYFSFNQLASKQVQWKKNNIECKNLKGFILNCLFWSSHYELTVVEFEPCSPAFHQEESP